MLTWPFVRVMLPHDGDPMITFAFDCNYQDFCVLEIFFASLVHLMITCDSMKPSLRKQLTFYEVAIWASAKQRLSNEHRNSILMTCLYSDLGSASDWLKENSKPSDWLKEIPANQKHYKDLGRDTSSVWSFCGRCSDVILRGLKVLTSWNISCFLWLHET